jgi:transmembrane sensor
MSTRLNHQEIDQIAAHWAARRCNGLSANDAAALDAWLEADPRHFGAYMKAEAVLARLDQAGAAGAEALRPRDDVYAGPVLARRRTVLMGAAAACLAVAVAGGAVVRHMLQEEVFATNIGETKEVVLSDGSIVTLNTSTRIAVRYTKALRQIALLQGEALFDVAKNKQRPFIVQAHDTQVRAVGTSFTVKILPQHLVQVLVREGVIEIKRPDVPEALPVRLAANNMALAPMKAPISTAPIPTAQVGRSLAWRQGRIAFDNETLADAAREFGRYSDIQIRVTPDLEGQTVTGLFVSTDPVGFARAAALSLNLRVDVQNRAVTISR